MNLKGSVADNAIDETGNRYGGCWKGLIASLLAGAASECFGCVSVIAGRITLFAGMC